MDISPRVRWDDWGLMVWASLQSLRMPSELEESGFLKRHQEERRSKRERGSRPGARILRFSALHVRDELMFAMQRRFPKKSLELPRSLDRWSRFLVVRRVRGRLLGGESQNREGGPESVDSPRN